MKWRWAVFLMSLSALGALLAIRMVELQVWRGDYYVAAAEANRLYSLHLSADRGVILDRYGVPLVKNNRSYGLVINPNQLYQETEPIDVEEALPLLATESGLIARQSNREYPIGDALAHVVGYVGAATREDLERRPQLKLSSQVGKLGLERYFDQTLQGVDGKEVWEIDALVRRQRQVSYQEPETGASLTTSLDTYLTEIARQALQGYQGSVIVVDVDTGQLLTVVSLPSFDPNLFSRLATATNPEEKTAIQAELQRLTENEAKPFFNRAARGMYPPGSVFKLVTALAGLESGAFTADTTVLDEGVLKVGEYEYRNWLYRKSGGTDGDINVVRAIARSNDIYFYKAAEWTGPIALGDMARRLGLGASTGLEIGGEAVGVIPTPEWKEEVIGEPWYLGNTYHMGIGQGDVLVSPLQIAQLIQVLGNDGVLCGLSLTDAGRECYSVGVSEEHLAAVLQGMLDACSPGGTAGQFFQRNTARRQSGQSSSQDLNQGAVACKTGTAEFGLADARGFRKTHGWWVGIIEPRLGEWSKSDQLLVATDSAEVVAADADAQGSVYDQWRAQFKEVSFPERIGIIVLTESDDVQPYKEGSREAAGVGKALIDWIEQGYKPPVASESAVVAPVGDQGAFE